MPDVILIYPRTTVDIKNVTLYLPCSVLSLGTLLTIHGYSVRIIDQRVDEQWSETLRRTLSERPLWVGISAMTGQQILGGTEAARIVRENDPTIPIVWGGVHPTILPEQTLASPFVDMVVRGEGEFAVIELSDYFRSGDEKANALHQIAGLVWKRGNEIVQNSPHAPVMLNDLPALDYTLINVEHYINTRFPEGTALQIFTSRGCPMGCGYCYLTIVPHGRRYRAESPERTVAQIEHLIQLYHIDVVEIVDDEFFTQRERVQKICELLIEKNICVTLQADCCVKYVDQMDTAFLTLIRKAGFKYLLLGVESGNDRILKFINKGITQAQVLRVNRKLKEAGLIPRYGFMGGFPTERMTEVKDTLKLMMTLVTEYPDAHISHVQVYRPFPGTPLYKQSLDAGAQMPQTLEQWAGEGGEAFTYRSWFSRAEERFLQKVAYASFFIDGKKVAEMMRTPWLRVAVRFYGWIVRQRIRLNFYAGMPEIVVIRWVLTNKNRPIKYLTKSTPE